jgi:lysine 2,3-aminomutase
LVHKDLVEMPDFRRIPAYNGISDEQFLDHSWQAKSITKPEKLLEALQGLLRPPSSRTQRKASLALP